MRFANIYRVKCCDWKEVNLEAANELRTWVPLELSMVRTMIFLLVGGDVQGNITLSAKDTEQGSRFGEVPPGDRIHNQEKPGDGSDRQRPISLQ